MSKANIDIKKIIIIALPVIVTFFIFIFFFGKENTTNAKTVDVLLIPDSESEELPDSKTKIYEQEKRDKRAKIRESQESQITTSDFFNQVAKEDQEESKLSDKEKQKRIDQLFSSSLPDEAPRAFNKKEYKQKWEVKEVPDPLEEFDFEKKKKKNPIHKQRKEEEKDLPIAHEVVEKPVPQNIPGKRSRNNSIEHTTDINADGNLIPAVVHSDQIIKNGSTVKMRLTDDFYINEQKISRNTFVYGIARFNRERVDIEINAIRLGNNIIPFKKQVLDQDGLKGLYFPENAGNEMSKEVGADAIDEAYDIATSGTGIIGSVLSAGKSVIKKKNNEKKVNLKANYKIYLK